MRTHDLPKGQTLASLKPGEKASFWEKYPEAITDMVGMWNGGGSAKAIAIALSKDYNVAISRSAVLGKVCRLGLHRVDQRNTEITRVKVAAKQKHEAREKKEKEPHLTAEPGSLCDLIFEMPVTAVSIYDVKSHQCRWPVGETAKLLCCGVRKEHGARFPYCTDHHTRAIRKYTAKGAPYVPRTSKYR